MKYLIKAYNVNEDIEPKETFEERRRYADGIQEAMTVFVEEAHRIIDIFKERGYLISSVYLSDDPVCAGDIAYCSINSFDDEGKCFAICVEETE